MLLLKYIVIFRKSPHPKQTPREGLVRLVIITDLDGENQSMVYGKAET